MRRLALAALPALLAGRAHAHSFTAGADAYGAFLEGAGVIFGTPGLMLPLVALGLLVALWQIEGLLTAWPIFLGGQVAGMIAAPLVGPSAALLPISFGLVLGALAALVPLNRLGRAVPVLAGLMGLVVMLAGLEGHAWGELTIPIYLGLLFGANVAVSATAGIVRVCRETWPGEATRIGARIIASWVAAILVLYLAFALSGTPAA
ncbi:hypothetical protein [Maritimibacter dapengensis]|uniref:HupE / UreJ protein n=1 Tax=Maritimibacter dapengensis TaxID=2836868 RepID=A0ABS6T2T3_9RHOB|nr:hypothetical protein [Maritimibacter dapengensis]MBV7379569.1 hypothetical protein [Maritimibacter dapengensis]